MIFNYSSRPFFTNQYFLLIFYPLKLPEAFPKSANQSYSQESCPQKPQMTSLKVRYKRANQVENSTPSCFHICYISNEKNICINFLLFRKQNTVRTRIERGRFISFFTFLLVVYSRSRSLQLKISQLFKCCHVIKVSTI